MTPAVLLAVALAAPPPPWPADEITLANGAKLSGLILDDSAAGVRFQVVRRPPGRPTVTLTTYVPRAEVAGVRKLSDADRAVLRGRVAELDATGAGERRRMEELDLATADWLGRPGAAKRYDSEHFVLIAPVRDEETARRAAVRLEQIYTAYARFLPSRVKSARPTTVLLAPDADDYRALVGPVLNPAVFDPGANRIVVRTDLTRAADDLKRVRLHHSQQLAALDKYEADLRRLYKQRAELDRHLEPVTKERKRVRAAETENDAAFDRAARRPFALLYHEAFHAYVGNFVYPPGAPPGELPRWLNEGLAQIFETAVLEAGELRVGHADRDRLDRVKGLVKAGGLTPLPDLLRAGKEGFVALHADQKAAADRTYLTAWAVGFHLLFERRVLGTPGFDAYLAAVNAGGDPVAAFAELVGRDSAGYEQELRGYLERLQPDGAVRK